MESNYKLGRLAVNLIIGMTVISIFIIILLSESFIYTVVIILVGFISIGLSQLMTAVFDIADNTRQSLGETKPFETENQYKNMTDDKDLLVSGDTSTKVKTKSKKDKSEQCRFCGTESEGNETHCIKCSNEL